ncbi:hypothetical protein EYZ11_009319 [Aspergillus tanneri]|uniref:Uncharacterized protein n=1 Tax=Aspergillus tanneri TaxID=1220188 RepID=A0A4S3J8L5_9EURO|nr:hypothetical protein EYZ11_009319 [Aspergillus tanneri]
MQMMIKSGKDPRIIPGTDEVWKVTFPPHNAEYVGFMHGLARPSASLSPVRAGYLLQRHEVRIRMLQIRPKGERALPAYRVLLKIWVLLSSLVLDYYILLRDIK